MYLEDIARQYGMNDYLDNNTGKIYQLSKAIEDTDGTLLVPVVPVFGDNILEGYARMHKVEEVHADGN